MSDVGEIALTPEDAALIDRALSLEKTAVSALVSLFEDVRSSVLPRRAAVLDAIRKDPRRKYAALLGLTGTPGSGKSSLVARCAPMLLERDPALSVAVVAVDPSSHISGGALLGDRTRMRPNQNETRLFFRSQASETQAGGLGPSTFQVCRLLSCLFDCVIIETVGVGQGEADIRHLADRVFLVMQPLGGDEVQFLKAGIMEVPHAFIINKCDEPSSVRSYHTLVGSLGLARPGETQTVPVHQTSARTGIGLDELCQVFLDVIRTESGKDLQTREPRFFTKWVQDEWGKTGLRFVEANGGAEKYLEAHGGFESAQAGFGAAVLVSV